MNLQIKNSISARKNGLASMVCIILLAVMMVLVATESRALFRLHREVKFLEQQQIKQLHGHATNGLNQTNHDAK